MRTRKLCAHPPLTTREVPASTQRTLAPKHDVFLRLRLRPFSLRGRAARRARFSEAFGQCHAMSVPVRAPVQSGRAEFQGFEGGMLGVRTTRRATAATENRESGSCFHQRIRHESVSGEGMESCVVSSNASTESPPSPSFRHLRLIMVLQYRSRP